MDVVQVVPPVQLDNIADDAIVLIYEVKTQLARASPPMVH